MKTRNAVRIISFCLAAVIVAVGFLIKTVNKANRYALELKNSYSKNLDDFNSAVDNIAITLNKLQYAATEKQVGSLANILLTEAEISKAALSQMPQTEELTTLNRFFSQVGNYALALSESIGNEDITLENTEENIGILADTAKKIAEASATAQSSFNNDSYWAKELEKEINSLDDSGLSKSLNQLEDSLTDFPTLIYDGPYSDHLLEKEPSLLKDAPEVTELTALGTAALFADTKSSELIPIGKTGGHIPSYCFEGNGMAVAVSVSGGHTLYMRKERNVENTILSIEQAREKAKRYLSRTEMTGFKETYYFLNENVLVINYCYVDGGTLCYTDLIKIGVAMDNGEIVFYEAGGYIANHRERAFLTPVYSAEEAEAVLSKNLTVKGVGFALIPTHSMEEIRCYEFHCQAPDNTEILIYINPSTLEEEDILILLKSDGGTLVK
ncbi:MAG: germination protein YpeB [Clostridia bacterium]|nr:germination protein YpeB [Clostridia bacterium]